VYETKTPAGNDCYIFDASSSFAQAVGEEKEPELRTALLRLVKQNQEIRGEYNKFGKEHGLFGIDNKTLNQQLDSDPALKKGVACPCTPDAGV